MDELKQQSRNVSNIEVADLNKIGPPLAIFEMWFEEAKKSEIKHPEAFVLSTVGLKKYREENKSNSGGKSKTRPIGEVANTRVVLMKEIRKQGIVFYTNYESHKGQELEKNNFAAAHFYWDPLFQQVKIQGEVSKVTRKESASYWAVRPRASQISQWVSMQSHPVPNRLVMDEEYLKAERKFAGRDIPCPKNWGGYILRPTYVEFWVGREGRFHDRYAYQKVENRWFGQRLYP